MAGRGERGADGARAGPHEDARTHRPRGLVCVFVAIASAECARKELAARVLGETAIRSGCRCSFSLRSSVMAADAGKSIGCLSPPSRASSADAPEEKEADELEAASPTSPPDIPT